MDAHETNLAKAYLQYLCFIYNTSFPKLSRKLGHQSSWLSSDIFNPSSTISAKYYRKCLIQLSKIFNIPYTTLLTLYHNNSRAFHKITNRIYWRITTRKDLIGYLRLYLTMHNESLTTVAKKCKRGNNYFRNGLMYVQPGVAYKNLLLNLAKVTDLPKYRLIKFSTLPKTHHTNMGRKRVYKFLQCYTKAIGTDLKALSKQANEDLGKGILFGSYPHFKYCLKVASKLIYIPISTFKLVINNNPVVYKSIKITALHHVHDRKTLEQCITCLAMCNNNSLRNIGREYHYPKDKIIACLSRNYYQPIEDLLLNIRLSLGVSAAYIHQIMIKSNIPKKLGYNGNYDNLIALIKCYCLKKHTTIVQMSKDTFDGNKDKLLNLLNKDFTEFNSNLINQLTLTGLTKVQITKVLNGNNLPVKKLIKQIGKQVHNRKSLITYVHAVAIQYHTTFTNLSKQLHRPNGYISGVLFSNYYESIALLFKQLAKLLRTPLNSLMDALNKSKIRYSNHVRYPYRRRTTKLDWNCRVNIKKQLYNIMIVHHIYPTKLNFILHPKATSSGLLSGHLMHCSRDMLIKESALILNYLHESPKLLKVTLDQNKMGKYYSLLVQKCHHLTIENKKRN